MILKFEEATLMKDKEFQKLSQEEKDKKSIEQLKKDGNTNHTMELFQTHPCHTHRYEDLVNQVKKMNELKESEDTKSLMIYKQITNDDKKNVKELEARYQQLRPLIIKYNNQKKAQIQKAAEAQKSKEETDEKGKNKFAKELVSDVHKGIVGEYYK